MLDVMFDCLGEKYSDKPVWFRRVYYALASFMVGLQLVLHKLS